MQLRLIHRRNETKDIMTFVFAYDGVVSWTPGESMRLTLLDSNLSETEREHWFSISSAPYERVLSFTMKMTPSPFKNALERLPIGSLAKGDHIGGVFLLRAMNRPVVFIAGGVGITPFHAIMKQMVKEGKKIPFRLFYASATKHKAFSEDLLVWQKDHPEFVYYDVRGRQLSFVYLESCFADIRESDIYVAGPEPMVDAVGRSLLENGVMEKSLLREWYPGYTTL